MSKNYTLFQRKTPRRPRNRGRLMAMPLKPKRGNRMAQDITRIQLKRIDKDFAKLTQRAEQLETITDVLIEESPRRVRLLITRALVALRGRRIRKAAKR